MTSNPDGIERELRREAIMNTYKAMCRKHPDQIPLLDKMLKIKLRSLENDS